MLTLTRKDTAGTVRQLEMTDVAKIRKPHQSWIWLWFHNAPMGWINARCVALSVKKSLDNGAKVFLSFCLLDLNGTSSCTTVVGLRGRFLDSSHFTLERSCLDTKKSILNIMMGTGEHFPKRPDSWMNYLSMPVNHNFNQADPLEVLKRSAKNVFFIKKNFQCLRWLKDPSCEKVDLWVSFPARQALMLWDCRSGWPPSRSISIWRVWNTFNLDLKA